MQIKPDNFMVSCAEIQQRLKLGNSSVIVPFGIEAILDLSILQILKSRYDQGSLFLRTRPDFFIIEENDIYFVEAKKETSNLEAIQLLYNKQYDKMGIKVVYSFPNFAIRASLIPIKYVVIPQNYKKEFDKNLKDLFELEGIKDFKYVGHVAEGSGDAFVPVDISELLLRVEGTSP